MLTPQEVMFQSKSAFDQWDKIWRGHAAKNGEVMADALKKGNGRRIKQCIMAGAGRNVLIVAYAPSLETHIEKIKKYKDNIDIACVDKAWGDLLKNGIEPRWLFTCDAGTDFTKWFEPYLDKIGDTTLCLTVCAEPRLAKAWHEKGGKIVFFLNKDNINSEKIYGEISKCEDMIPAGSNVGNAAIIFLTQICGYDNHYLIGYDYCWRDDQNYYAFVDHNKRYWMNHLCMTDISGRLVNTSQNLCFSARWMSDFYKAACLPHKKKVFNVSGEGICDIPQKNIEKALRDSIKQRPLTEQEKNYIIEKRLEMIVVNDQNGAEARMNTEVKTRSCVDVTIRYIPEEVKAWLQI